MNDRCNNLNGSFAILDNQCCCHQSVVVLIGLVMNSANLVSGNSTYLKCAAGTKADMTGK